MRHLNKLLLVCFCAISVGAGEVFKNRQAENARKKYDVTVKKAESDYVQVLTIAKQQYQKELTEAKKVVMKNQDLEQAKRIDDLIKDLDTDSQEPQRPKRKRPKNAVEFNGHWYVFVTEPATWHQAQRKCEEAGGYLVRIESEEENDFVKQTEGPTWIGATDEMEEGKWRWVTGSPVKWVNWYPGEPQNWNLQQHHVAINWYDRSGKWVDMSGDARLRFICEWEK